MRRATAIQSRLDSQARHQYRSLWGENRGSTMLTLDASAGTLIMKPTLMPRTNSLTIAITTITTTNTTGRRLLTRLVHPPPLVRPRPPRASVGSGCGGSGRLGTLCTCWRRKTSGASTRAPPMSCSRARTATQSTGRGATATGRRRTISTCG